MAEARQAAGQHLLPALHLGDTLDPLGRRPQVLLTPEGAAFYLPHPRHWPRAAARSYYRLRAKLRDAVAPVPLWAVLVLQAGSAAGTAAAYAVADISQTAEGSGNAGTGHGGGAFEGAPVLCAALAWAGRALPTGPLEACGTAASTAGRAVLGATGEQLAGRALSVVAVAVPWAERQAVRLAVWVLSRQGALGERLLPRPLMRRIPPWAQGLGAAVTGGWAVLGGLTLVHRAALMLALRYHGWVEEPAAGGSAKRPVIRRRRRRGAPATPAGPPPAPPAPRLRLATRLWYLTLSLLMRRGPGVGAGAASATAALAPLMAYQSTLPSLPLPTVSDTVERYLATMAPLLPPEQFGAVRAAAAAFLSRDAPRLQALLRLRYWTTTNYVSRWWRDVVYLRSRSSLLLNSNYYGLSTYGPPPTTNQAARAAVTVYLVAQIRMELERQDLPPLYTGRGLVPLCMAQYRHVIGTTRVPALEADTLEMPAAPRHVAIICGCGRLYRLATHCRLTGRPLSPVQLEAAIIGIFAECRPLTPVPRAVRESSAGSALPSQPLPKAAGAPRAPSPPPPPPPAHSTGTGGASGGTAALPERGLPALTALPRGEWAAVRTELLLRDRANRVALEAIESAAGVLCLDATATDWRDLTGWARRMLHGTGADRWLDKSVCFGIDAGGLMGGHGEHSWGDAMVTGHVCEMLQAREAGLMLTVPGGLYDPVDGSVRLATHAATVGSLAAGGRRTSPRRRGAQTSAGTTSATTPAVPPAALSDVLAGESDAQLPVVMAGGRRCAFEPLAGLPGTPFAPVGADETPAAAEHRLAAEALEAPRHSAERLLFHVTPPLRAAIDRAEAAAAAAIADHQHLTFRLEGVSSGTAKAAGCSPDAFAQMALQLAYYRDQGGFTQTYESAATRLFLDGRTETIRSVSDASCAFVRAMEAHCPRREAGVPAENSDAAPAETPADDASGDFDSAAAPTDDFGSSSAAGGGVGVSARALSRTRVVRALRTACAEHRRLTSAACTGKGVDRHLFALYVVAVASGTGGDGTGDFLPSVLERPWRLSTSQIPQTVDLPQWARCGVPPSEKERRFPFVGGGFAPVSDEGYGVCYTFTGDSAMFLHVSAKASCAATDTERFGAAIRLALEDMRDLFK